MARKINKPLTTDVNRGPEMQEVFKKKSVPKKPIAYNIVLSEEQEAAKQVILDNQVTVLYGVAGTSKTTVASITALDLLFKKQIGRITLIRPTVASENIGYLKGDKDDKMSPWFTPVVENLYDIYSKGKIDALLTENRIRFLPLQFAQGVNFKNEVVIFEEAENATLVQIRMALTRLCDGAKVIFTGDVGQIQLRREYDSGFDKLLSICDKIENMACFELTENRRSKIVRDILELY